MKILLAEDNDDDVFFLQQAFKRAGVGGSLHVVKDGVQALSYLKGESGYSDRLSHPFPDVLLLDINMPRMNGLEVLKWVRQDSPMKSLIIHVLSTSGREADVRRAYELGANSYVMKPSRLDELVAFVSALHQWHRFICLPALSACVLPVTEVR